MLEKEFEYFQKNHDQLYSKYPNRYIVIKDQLVHFDGDSFEESLAFASKKFEIGTFLIQLCTEGIGGYTQTFHSRVIFA